LSGRLATEEQAARDSLELARQQVQLNRLVIEEMADGVMVVDRRARVRVANPAARRLLVANGIGPAVPFQLQDDPAWAGLMAQVVAAFDAGAWPRHGQGHRAAVFGHQRAHAAPARSLHALALGRRSCADRQRSAQRGRRGIVRVVPRGSAPGAGRARARKSWWRWAGSRPAFAHEIRNPLAAIAQANALLSEDATGAEQRQLTQVVTTTSSA
jgi:two-component system sensor histidine kinase PilS (NtrC family)